MYPDTWALSLNFKNTDWWYIPDIPGYISDLITDIPHFPNERKVAIITSLVT